MAARSRRSQFEEQLRELQRDISSLSLKLSTPTGAAVPIMDKSVASIASGGPIMPDNSMLSRGTWASAESKNSTGEENIVVKLKEELDSARSERDDALFRLKQANIELEELRRMVQENIHIRATFEHLKQDHESLRVSLESSERIRKQQKELISLLQRSQAAAIDCSSVMSGPSLSSISHREEQNSSATATSSFIAAENRSWLNGHNHVERSIPAQNNYQLSVVSYTNQDTESKFGLPNTIAATSNVLKERTSVKKIAGNKTKTSSKTRKVASQPRSSGSNVNRRTSTNVTNKTNRLPSKKVSETTLRTTSGRSSHRIDESSQTDHISSTLPGSTTLDAAVQATPPRTVHQSTSKPSKSMTMAASVYNNPLVRTGKPPRHPSRIEVAPKQSSKSITRLRSRSAPVSRPGESLSANILMDLSQSDDKGSREFYRAIPSPSTTFGKSRR